MGRPSVVHNALAHSAGQRLVGATGKNGVGQYIQPDEDGARIGRHMVLLDPLGPRLWGNRGPACLDPTIVGLVERQAQQLPYRLGSRWGGIEIGSAPVLGLYYPSGVA